MQLHANPTVEPTICTYARLIQFCLFYLLLLILFCVRSKCAMQLIFWFFIIVNKKKTFYENTFVAPLFFPLSIDAWLLFVIVVVWGWEYFFAWSTHTHTHNHPAIVRKTFAFFCCLSIPMKKNQQPKWLSFRLTPCLLVVCWFFFQLDLSSLLAITHCCLAECVNKFFPYCARRLHEWKKITIQRIDYIMMAKIKWKKKKKRWTCKLATKMNRKFVYVFFFHSVVSFSIYAMSKSHKFAKHS